MPRTHGVAGDRVQPAAFLAQPPDTGLVELLDARRRFDMREDVQALAEHQLAAGSPGERVDVLMRIARVKPFEKKSALAGLVPVVLQMDDLAVLADIDPALPELQAH